MSAPIEQSGSYLDELLAGPSTTSPRSSMLDDVLRDAETVDPTQYNKAMGEVPLGASPRFAAESPEWVADEKLKARSKLIEERPRLRSSFERDPDLPMAIGPDRLLPVAQATDHVQEIPSVYPPDPDPDNRNFLQGIASGVGATAQATVDQVQSTVAQYGTAAYAMPEMVDALTGSSLGGARNRANMREAYRYVMENQRSLEKAPFPGQMVALGIGQSPHLGIGLVSRALGVFAGGAAAGPPGAAVGGFAGPVLPMAALEGGLFWAEADRSMPDVPVEDRAAMALLVGAINGSLELVPFDTALSTMTGKLKRDAMKLLANKNFRDYAGFALKRILTQTIAEGGTEALQEIPGTLIPALRQYAVGEIDLEGVVDSILNAEFGKAALHSAMMGAMGAPVVASISLTVGAVGFNEDVKEAQQNRDVFQKLADDAVANKEVISEMPERYQKLMEDALDEDGQIDGVYLTPEALIAAYGEESAELSRLLELVPGLSARVSLAQQLDGKVRLSLPEFATYVAPGEQFSKMADDLSFREDQSSLREAIEAADPKVIEAMRAKLDVIRESLGVDPERDTELAEDFTQTMGAIFEETMPGVSAPVREKNAELLSRIVMRIAEMDGTDPLEAMTNLLDRAQFEQRPELDSAEEVARSNQVLREGGTAEVLGQEAAEEIDLTENGLRELANWDRGDTHQVVQPDGSIAFRHSGWRAVEEAPDGATIPSKEYAEQLHDLHTGELRAEDVSPKALRAWEDAGLLVRNPLPPRAAETLRQSASFEPRTETPQEGFSVIPVGRVETEFGDLVDSVGVDGLTAETLAGVTGSPSPRGVKAGNDARKFLTDLPKERKKLNAKLKAAKSDAEKKRIQKKLDDLKVKAKKKKVDLAREKDLSRLDSRVKPRSFAELSEFIEIAMGEAGDQSDWYKQFGEGIRGLVGRANLQEASVVFGITSAQNSTRQNLKDTLRIMIIARQHNPLSDPAAFKRAIMQRPKGKGISISSNEVDNIIRMYQSGTYKGGLKVSNYMNLIRDRADNVFSPYTVQDVHMARVIGFLFRNEKTSDKTGITTVVDGAQMPSADGIRYSMFMTELLANKFGIKPDAVQALLWFYAKNHLSPKLPNERALTNLEKLYIEHQRELNPTPAEDVEGSIEEAMAFSSEEIAELTGLKQNGAFDTEEPLSQALSDGDRPHFRSDVKSDPYSNIDLDPDLLDLAQARAPRSTVSANPGRARGYGLPQDTPLSVLQDHERRTIEAITDEDGQVTILRAMGIVHEVGHTLGTWDRMEPSMVFTLPGETIETADFVSRLLGDALLQDAAITSQPSWEGQEFAVSFSKKDGSSLTEQEVSDLYEALNPEHSTKGLNFTVSPDGTSLDFRDGRYFESGSYSEEHLDEFLAKISGVLGDSFAATPFNEKGKYHGAKDFAGESGRDSGEVWDGHGLAGRPDLQETAQRSLYEPAWQVYRDTIAQLGIQPERTEGPLGQPLQRSGSPGERSQEHEANHRRLGLLDDGGNPVSLDDLHQGTKTSPSVQRAVYRAMGLSAVDGQDTNAGLKIYPLQDVFSGDPAEVDAQLRTWLNSIGWTYKVFGPGQGEGGKPLYPDFQDPSTPSYEDKVAWIFDPTNEEGSFRDHAYTLAWRVTHEVAHGFAEVKLTEKYNGKGRRAGAMGVVIRGPHYKQDSPRSLSDAMRAVEWEHEAFIEQRRILAQQFGIEISDEQFLLENSINMSDAVYRAVTGQFGSPGDLGVTPKAIDNGEVLVNAFDILETLSQEIDSGQAERDAPTVLKQDAAKTSTRGQLIVDRRIQKFLLQISEQKVNDSTLTHELFHLALELVLDASEGPNATPEILEFRDQILGFLGVESRDQIGRDQHERWAESGEVYMASGSAPTAELRNLFRFFFQRFKQVYRAIRDELRNADPNSDFVPIFDRLLASEDEIRREANRDHAVAPLLAPELTSLMTVGEEEEIRKKMAAVQSSERQRLERTIAKEDERVIKAQMGELKQAVREEVYSRPDHKLAFWLRTGGTVTGEPLQVFILGARTDEHKMNGDLVDEVAGDVSTRKSLGNMTKKEGGLSPDQVAAASGFNTAEEMLIALLNMEPSEALITRLTHERAEEIGIVSTREELQAAAAEKVDGQARDRLYDAQRRIAKRLRGEMPALDRVERRALDGEAAPAVGEAQERVKSAKAALEEAIQRGAEQDEIQAIQVEIASSEAGVDAAREARADQAAARREAKASRSKMPASAIRSAARDIVNDTEFGQLKREVARWKKLRSKSSITQTDAAMQRDWEALEAAIDQEQLANALAEEGAKRLEEVQKWKKYVGSFDARGSRKRARLSKHADFQPDEDGPVTNVMDVIDTLLDMVSFKNISLRKLNRATDINSFARDVESDTGVQLPLPAWVLDVTGQPNYKQMKVGELEDLYVGIKALEHFGMGMVKDREKAGESEEQAEVDELLGSLEQQKRVLWAGSKKYAASQRSKKADVAGQIIGSQMSFESISDILDDLNPEGAFNKYFMHRFKAAEREAKRLNKMVSERISSAWDRYSARERREFYNKPIKIHSLGESMTKNELMSIAANMGNDHNRAALMDAAEYGFNQEQLDEILSHVTDRDADYLEAVVAAVDLLWEPAAKAEKEINGVVPPKVEAVPWMLPSGRMMKGGYWPLKFDGALSVKSADQQARAIGKDLMPAGGGAAMTKVGAMKARKTTSGKQTPRADFHAVLQQHVSSMAKDIAWRGTLVKADRQLKKLGPELKRVLGERFYGYMRDYLKRQGTSLREADRVYPEWILKVMRASRHGLGISVMAWRLTQAAIQAGGFVVSIPRVGVGNMAWGLADVGSSLWNWDKISQYREMIPELKDRAETFDRDAQQEMLRLHPIDIKRPIASLEPIRAFNANVGYTLLGMVDTVASTAVASAAMHQAMSGQIEGINANDVDASIRYAGKIVTRTQGAGGSVNAPALLDGGEMMKLMTPMMTFVNAQFQQYAVYAALGQRQFGDPLAPKSMIPGIPRDAARLIAFYIFQAIVEPMLSESIRFGIQGFFGPDEPDEDKFFSVLKARAVLGVFGTAFITKDFEGIYRGFSPDTPYTGLIMTAYNATIKPAIDIGEGDYDAEKHIRALATATTYATGAPTKQSLSIIEILTQESFGRGRK